MNDNLELKNGQQVRINIPFLYEIGEVGFFTNKKLKTIKDCLYETRKELEDIRENSSALYLETILIEREVLTREDAIDKITQFTLESILRECDNGDYEVLHDYLRAGFVGIKNLSNGRLEDLYLEYVGEKIKVGNN